MWPAVARAPSAGAAGPPAGAGHAAGAEPGVTGLVCVVASGPPRGAGVLGRAWKTARQLAKVAGVPLGVPRLVPGPLSTGPLACTSNVWVPPAAKEGGSGGGPAMGGGRPGGPPAPGLLAETALGGPRGRGPTLPGRRPWGAASGTVARCTVRGGPALVVGVTAWGGIGEGPPDAACGPPAGAPNRGAAAAGRLMGAGAGAALRSAGGAPVAGWGCGTRCRKAAGGALCRASFAWAAWAASATGAAGPWVPEGAGTWCAGPPRGVVALGGGGLPIGAKPRWACASGGRRGGGGLPAGVLVGGRWRAGSAPAAPVGGRLWVAAGAAGGGGLP